MNELIAKWRREANEMNRSWQETEMWCLWQCADELERAWHDAGAHVVKDARCAICREEMEEKK